MNRMNIAVDFDGTIVDHAFPDIGQPVPGAIEWLKRIQEHADLMLWTMRSDGRKEGDFLSPAIEYLFANDVIVTRANVNPDQRHWTSSPKLYAPIYIDDAAFGCPLRAYPGFLRLAVDWEVVGPAVLETARSYAGR